jgi:hypothetical protein
MAKIVERAMASGDPRVAGLPGRQRNAAVQAELTSEAKRQAKVAQENFRKDQITDSHFRAERAKRAREDHVSAMLLAGAQAVEYDDCLNDHEDGLEHLASHWRGHEDADDFA